MAEHIPEIRGLSHMPGGLDLAYRLILHLGDCSFHEASIQSASDLSSRPSDQPTDDLLVDIANRLNQTKPDSAYLQDLNALYQQKRTFWKHGVHTYCQLSFNTLFRLTYGPNYARSFFKELKSHATAKAQQFEDRIQRLVEPNAPTNAVRNTQLLDACSNLSKSLCDYVPRIQQLATMDDGLPLAFDLILWLGRQSYTE